MIKQLIKEWHEAVDYWRERSDFVLTQPQGYFSYSNFGINLGCVVIEHAWKKSLRNKKSFEEIFMQLVGTPFGMTSMQADKHQWYPDPLQTKRS